MRLKGLPFPLVLELFLYAGEGPNNLGELWETDLSYAPLIGDR